MDIFKCKVRLGGSVMNEVEKIAVTAPEVILLRAIHGGDAVVNLKRTGEKRAEHAVERDRLAEIYGERKVIEVFGPGHQALPTKVGGYSDEDPSVLVPSAEDIAANIATIDEPDALMA